MFKTCTHIFRYFQRSGDQMIDIGYSPVVHRPQRSSVYAFGWVAFRVAVNVRTGSSRSCFPRRLRDDYRLRRKLVLISYKRRPAICATALHELTYFHKNMPTIEIWKLSFNCLTYANRTTRFVFQPTHRPLQWVIHLPTLSGSTQNRNNTQPSIFLFTIWVETTIRIQPNNFLVNALGFVRIGSQPFFWERQFCPSLSNFQESLCCDVLLNYRNGGGNGI